MRHDPASAGTAAIRVLLVEDDERLARLTSRYLEGHGLAVTWAGDGAAGLAAAERGGFDVVLLDLLLPGRGGLEVCRNAANYSDPATLVTLGARGRDDAVELEVIDRGIGIADGDRERVFEPFFRADRSRGRGSGGIGLGLTLARRIVDAHGGTIAVTSTLGAGTTVSVTVPRAPLAPPS